MQELKIQKLEELRNWLENNYDSKESIWLIYPKKTRGGEFVWADIVDVLLCYGWIDSLPKKIDENFTGLRISPRNLKSNWSKINKNKIVILIQKNLLHPNGLSVVKIAKQNGTWNALDEVESLTLPQDFKEYLDQHNLLETWHAKGRTFKRGFLEQLLNSKRPETRIKKMLNLGL